MTELEKRLLNTLETLQKNLEKHHSAYLNSSKELQTMHTAIKEENANILARMDNSSSNMSQISRLLRMASCS